MKITTFQNDLPDNFNIDGDIAIDTETMGLNLNRDRLCLLQFSNGDDNAYLVQFTDKAYNCPNLKKLLLDETRCKIFHFARFDLAMIQRHLGIRLDNIFCTKIASRLVRTYTDLHGLKELCRELLSVQISKQQQSSYWGTDKISSDQEEYAAKDVIYLHRIRSILIEMLKKEGRFEIAIKTIECLKTRVELDILGWAEIDIFAH